MQITRSQLETQFDQNPTYDNAFFVWQHCRQHGLPIDDEVRDKLYSFLDSEAKRRIDKHREQEFKNYDSRKQEAMLEALFAPEIIEFIDGLRDRGKTTEHWVFKVKRKYDLKENHLLCGKGYDWWRQYYYRAKKFI